MGPGQEGAIAGRPRAQRGEERADRLRVEGEARRKLKQHCREARHLLENERRVRPAAADQRW
jgi:hypothetical protein